MCAVKKLLFGVFVSLFAVLLSVSAYADCVLDQGTTKPLIEKQAAQNAVGNSSCKALRLAHSNGKCTIVTWWHTSDSDDIEHLLVKANSESYHVYRETDTNGRNVSTNGSHNICTDK